VQGQLCAVIFAEMAETDFALRLDIWTARLPVDLLNAIMSM